MLKHTNRSTCRVQIETAISNGLRCRLVVKDLNTTDIITMSPVEIVWKWGRWFVVGVGITIDSRMIDDAKLLFIEM